jgi:hypothetical protein
MLLFVITQCVHKSRSRLSESPESHEYHLFTLSLSLLPCVKCVSTWNFATCLLINERDIYVGVFFQVHGSQSNVSNGKSMRKSKRNNCVEVVMHKLCAY